MFSFNEDHILTRGTFYNPNEIIKINKLLNGSWIESTMSFEKYYPKFARKLSGNAMDFQIDALFFLNDKELKELNRILKSLGMLRDLKSKAYYYSIKCIYPHIFPIVSLVPAEFKNEKVIGIGNHYDKFFKSNLNKRDILTTMGINAVGKLREKFFEYKKFEVKEEEKEIYNRYLDVIKSTYRYDEEFIKKLGQAIYNIDDGDIINYADEVEFFLRNDHFKNFLDTIPLLREDEMIREDFAKLLFDVYLVDLKWIYSVKTGNNIVEIRNNIYKNNCEKALYSKELLEFFKTKLTLDKDIFDYSVSINHFQDNLDDSLIYNGESHFEKILEKGSEKTKFVEIKKANEKKEIIAKVKKIKEDQKAKEKERKDNFKREVKFLKAKNEQEKKELLKNFKEGSLPEKKQEKKADSKPKKADSKAKKADSKAKKPVTKKKK